MPENRIKELFIQTDNKVYDISLNENARGFFLRIREEVKGRANTVIIPAAALEDFHTVINEMMKAYQEAAAQTGSELPPATSDGA